MQASQRAVFNTLVTYLRSFITVFITLYTTKIIVAELGVKDFGLYSLVGGVVGMLAFFNSALKTSTQRYISVNIGKGLLEEIKKVVANSFVIHLVIGLIIVLISYYVGTYFIENKLVIPEERIDATTIVFYFVIASTFITIISVPAEAIINAHENLLFIAILGVIEVLLKFVAAIYLSYIYNIDKLIVYSFLLFLIFLVINLIKWSYCFYRYKETRVSIKRDFNKSQIKEQTSFVGWNLFGAACSMARGHGISIVSNMFFGSVVNAAYGVANQVKSQSSFFSTTVSNVLNPQIMKSEGANDRARMLRISMMASKFGFLLLALFAIPLIFEMDTVIKLWLGETPKYVVEFCSLILIGSLFEQLTVGFKSAVQSVGNIKYYQIIIGTIIILNLPLTYLFLSKGYPAEIALIIFVIIEFLVSIIRIKLTAIITGLKVESYLDRVFYPIILPVLVSSMVSFIIVNYVTIEYRFILTIGLSSLLFFLTVLFRSLLPDEKNILMNIYYKIFKKNINEK